VLFIAIQILIVLIRKSLIVWQLFVAKVETVGAPIASLPVNASTTKTPADAFDAVEQRQQDLSVGLAELLDDRRRFLAARVTK